MLSTFVFNLHTVYERYLVQSWLFLLIFHILFIKTLFPKEFADTEIDTIKNFKVDPRKSEIPIDEPEGDNFSFHYPEDYTPKQLL